MSEDINIIAQYICSVLWQVRCVVLSSSLIVYRANIMKVLMMMMRERNASLSVPEFDAHGVRLVLQALDLGADGSQVCLRTREVEKEEAEGELEEEEGGG